MNKFEIEKKGKTFIIKCFEQKNEMFVCVAMWFLSADEFCELYAKMIDMVKSKQFLKYD